MTEQQLDTIYALSSGSPPAAIAVVRISGPAAAAALQALAGSLPAPRCAAYRALHDPHSNELLDRALVLWFPGPGTATGEDLAELHLHGGRAVVAGVTMALGSMAGLRPALAGDFTRRAFENGRMDLAEAEGLADLLSAETQSQRRAALALAGGAFGRTIATWQDRLLQVAAFVEAQLDFSDEGDVGETAGESWRLRLDELQNDIGSWLERPPAERLKDGIRVVFAGPPNAGKSSLINALSGRDAAIVSAIAGTTRDVIEVPVAMGGLPFLLVDTAGLRDSHDEVERAGIKRAEGQVAAADIVLWLGEADQSPAGSILVAAKSDAHPSGRRGIAVSAITGDGLTGLTEELTQRAQRLLPAEGEVALNARHRELLTKVTTSLDQCTRTEDLLIVAEELRFVRRHLDAITGQAGVEEMLDTLFGGFCIGK